MGLTWLICRCDWRKQPARFFFFLACYWMIYLSEACHLDCMSFLLCIYFNSITGKYCVALKMTVLSSAGFCGRPLELDQIWSPYQINTTAVSTARCRRIWVWFKKKKGSPHTPSLLWNYLQHHKGAAHYNQNVVQSERLGTKCLIQHFGKKVTYAYREKMLISFNHTRIFFFFRSNHS